MVWSVARHRDAAQAIWDLTAAATADVLIVGDRGHGPVTRLLSGSVSLRLQRITRCPVMKVLSRIAVLV